MIFQGYCVRQECLFWGAWKVIEKGIFRIKSYLEFILNSVLCPECLIGRMNHFRVVDSFHVGEKRIIAISILGAFFLIEFIVRGRTVYSDVIRVIPVCPLAVRFLTVGPSTDPGSCSSGDIIYTSVCACPCIGLCNTDLCDPTYYTSVCDPTYNGVILKLSDICNL